MSVTDLRPRSATELVDASVQMVRQNFVPLMTISVVMLSPALIVLLFLSGSVAGVLLAGFVRIILSYLAQAALILAVSEAYLGRPIDVADTLRRALPRLGAVFLVTLLAGFITAFAFLLFIVPGIIAIARLFAAQPIVVIERRGATEALSRSNDLVKGSTGRILGALFLVYFILSIVVGVVAIGGQMVLLTLHAPFALVQVISTLAYAIFYPLIAAATTLIYYDLRIRKEGFDLEVMAGELGVSAPVTTSYPQAPPSGHSSPSTSSHG